MFGSVLRFELRYRTRQSLVYVLSAVFFLLTFGAATTDSIVIGGSMGAIAKNAPFVIVNMLALMSAVGVLVTTAFVASAVNRDHELRIASMLYTTRLRKLDYLLGRFVGAYLTALLPMIAAAAGILLGSFMPWQDPERIVPFWAAPYGQALAVFVLPNVFVTGAAFFSLATLSRRTLVTYVGVVAFFALYAISQAFIADLDNDWLAALADPFGIAAFQDSTRYWTIDDRNTRLVPLTGELLWNRLLWSAVGLVFLAVTVARYRMVYPEASQRRRWFGRRKPRPVLGEAGERSGTRIPEIALADSRWLHVQQWLRQTRLLTGSMIRSVPFIAIMLFGMLNVVGNAFGTIDQVLGTSVHPVTNLMLRVIGGGMSLYLLIVITFYGGELVWRERSAGMNEVYDALPVPNWVPLAAKITALIGAQLVLLTAAGITAIGIQLAKGHFDVQLGLYFKGLFLVAALEWALICVLSIFVQVMVNHKFLGFGVMVLYFIGGFALPALDIEHHLYRYGSSPSMPYSDMNGYGHFVEAWVWFNLCWVFAAIILGLIANLFWIRGTDNPVRVRIKLARRRITRRNTWALGLASLAFFVTAGWVVHSTAFVNDYVPTDVREELQATYEERYKKHEDLRQPTITDVEVDVDIYPKARRVRLAGTYRLENQHEVPIEELHVRVNPELEVHALKLPTAEPIAVDDEVGYRIYRLTEPMAPGATLEAEYDLEFRARGFKNHDTNNDVVENGTFINSAEYLPHFGYDPGRELQDPNERRKRGLPERQRAAPIDDPRNLARNPLSRDAHWVRFSATVSTGPEQIAIAPGYLQREWTEDGRRYFRYEMDAPILNFYSFLSADYEVARDRWKDVDIEIYYHEQHDYNVDKMIDSIKSSLRYFSENFSPYQHRQVRIIEFPRYASFAQSFPNTIPYSESLGFIADLTDPEDIDYVYYVTAHEVAHQWWGHQVVSGNVQGSTMVIETMAQYSALMVMEKQYGKDVMKRFLRYELDNYLRNRGSEKLEEKPLKLVEDQPYIHYRKGSLVLYALREYLGERAVNRALARFIDRYGFSGPPYPSAEDLVAEIRAETPPHLQYLVEDLFERIVLYENRTTSAKAVPTADGRYRVTVEVEARKLQADEHGRERSVPIDDYIQIGVLREREVDGVTREDPLYLEMHEIDQSHRTFEIVVDERPDKAGIDPRSLLIDRNPDDNTIEVKIED